MELYGWRLCRHKLVIALKEVVPTHTQVHRPWQHSFPQTRRQRSSPLLADLIMGEEEGSLWIWIFPVTCVFKYLCVFIEHCFFSEFALSFAHFSVVYLFLLICRKSKLRHVSFGGKNIYIQSNYLACFVTVCHIISSTSVEKS